MTSLTRVLLGLGESDRRITYLAKQFNITPEQVQEVAAADPTGGKYLTWLLRQQKANRLRFPEDTEKCRERLTQFATLSPKSGWNGPKDLNKVPSYGELAQLVDANLGVKTKGELVRAAQVNGVKLLNSQGDLSLYKITTPEAGAKLFRHTEWCVKDPEYFSQYGPPFYYLEKDGEPFKLLHFGNEEQGTSAQVMDVHDEPTRYDEFEQLGLDTSSLLKDPEWAYHYTKRILKGGWPEAEPYIMKDPQWAYWYAQSAIRRRWPEAEPTIMKDPEWACCYAEAVIKGRWPEAEPYIMKDPRWAYEYAKEVIEGRWPEAEPYIMKDSRWAYWYAKGVIKGRWPEAEPAILKDPGNAYWYALKVIRGPWPEAEPYILQDARKAYEYTCLTKRSRGEDGRWPEAEAVILQAQDPGLALDYATDVIEGRWPEAESILMTDPGIAHAYARKIIKGRWPEAEPIIATDYHAALGYVQDVIKGPWPEAEATLRQNPFYWDEYVRFL